MRAFFFSAFVSCAAFADDDFYSRQLEQRRVDTQLYNQQLDQRRYESQRFENNRVEQQRVRQQQDTEAQTERDARSRQQQQQRSGTSSLAPFYPTRKNATPRPSMKCAPLTLAAPQKVEPDFTGYFQNSYVFAAMKLGESASRLTVSTHFRDGKPLSAVGYGKTEVHYYVGDVDYAAVSGSARITRADQREQAGSYALRITNLVLVERGGGRCFVAPDFTFTASWDRAPTSTCRTITIPQLTEMDADVGFYKPGSSASYLRSAQGFETSSGKAGFSFVLSKTDGWPSAVDGGGVHLKLMLFGREYRAVSGALGYPRMRLSVAEGDVVVRVRNARFEQVDGDDCITPETFDLAVQWAGVDPLTRDASLH